MKFGNAVALALAAVFAAIAPALAVGLSELTNDTGLGVAGDLQVRLRSVGAIPDPSARIIVGGAGIGGSVGIRF